MAKEHYNTVKKALITYMNSWITKETSSLTPLFHPWVRFYTSTSKTMSNGAQASIFGIYDFINDFPKTDVINIKVYNFTCRTTSDEAYFYFEAPIFAYNKKDFSFIEMTAAIAGSAKISNGKLLVDELRQEIVYEQGDLLEYFQNNWHFEINSNERVCLIRGECDSPWLNVRNAQEVLTEEEKVKDVVIKFFYGQEWNSFYHCFETLSNGYHMHYLAEEIGERKKDYITVLRYARDRKRYDLSPIKFIEIKFEGDRAFVKAERVRGLKQNSREYQYNDNNLNIEHTCAQLQIELKKTFDGYKITYVNSYKGLYETDVYHNKVEFGDLC